MLSEDADAARVAQPDVGANDLIGRTIVAVETFTDEGARWRQVRLDNGGRVQFLADGPLLLLPPHTGGARIPPATALVQQLRALYPANPFDHNGECLFCDALGTHAPECVWDLVQRLARART